MTSYIITTSVPFKTTILTDLKLPIEALGSKSNKKSN